MSSLKYLPELLEAITKWIKQMIEVKIRPVDNGYILTFNAKHGDEKEEIYKTYKEAVDRATELMEEHPIQVNG